MECDHRASRTGRRLAFSALRGVTGSKPPAGQAASKQATTPESYPLPTSASNEVLPYAGFPPASEIFQTTLLRHALAAN